MGRNDGGANEKQAFSGEGEIKVVEVKFGQRELNNFGVKGTKG